MSEEIEFISNDKTPNHLEVIKELLSQADEVWMATAFLKYSGTELLLSSIKSHIKKGKPISIIAGQHFGLTDPDALKMLFECFQKHTKANAYLDKAVNKTQTFHPKLSLFRIGETGVIITGSANITSGGLVSNQEVSMKATVALSSDAWKDALLFMTERLKESNAELLSLMLINRYRSYYDEEKGKRKNQKPAPDKTSDDFAFNYKLLLHHLQEFKLQNGENEFEERVEIYEEAKDVLDEITDSPRLSQKRFEELLDRLVVGERLWSSGSLYRHRKSVYQYKNEFRELLRFIRENQDAPISKVFEGAKFRVDQIKGAAVNYITEIMMTYRPDRFANLNRNPITVLDKEAGVYFKSHSSSFTGADYENYCAQLNEIASKLGLKNMLEVDSFFNNIYWKIKE
jgi:HKD family nuclease